MHFMTPEKVKFAHGTHSSTSLLKAKVLFLQYLIYQYVTVDVFVDLSSIEIKASYQPPYIVVDMTL